MYNQLLLAKFTSTLHINTHASVQAGYNVTAASNLLSNNSMLDIFTSCICQMATEITKQHTKLSCYTKLGSCCYYFKKQNSINPVANISNKAISGHYINRPNTRRKPDWQYNYDTCDRTVT